jgi:hypothetical protein
MDFPAWCWTLALSRSAMASGKPAAIDGPTRLNAWQVAPCPA